MNTKMRTTLMVAAGLCLLLTALAALAAGGDGLRPGPAGGPQSLTPEQRKAVLDIRQKHEKALFDLHQKLARARVELHIALAAEKPDEKRIKALSADIGRLVGEGVAERAAQRLELRANGLPERPGFGRHHGHPGPRGPFPGLGPDLGAGPDAAPGLLAGMDPGPQWSPDPDEN